ncbi:hypothetical protein JA9_004299 [Meyerozyma sp. JA9]|nr:hypothetical protein JA9_004299 [Meyerozyma sp. JA9]
MSLEKQGPLNVAVTSRSTMERGRIDPKSGVKRGLKVRHISMMALAGIIGPGLFIGMGSALHAGGPAGLLAGFAIVGLLVVVMMFSIGEMNSLFDFNFNTHASRWVDPAFGAALGWNYAFLWVCNIIAEYVSVTSVLSFYSDKVPIYGYYLILWFFFSIYQMFGVDVFGEVEYILAFIKILFLTGFYLFAVIFAAGGVKGKSPGNPFGDYPLAHGFKGVANSFVYAGVFYTGIESLSITFSESKNVKKSVRRAVSQSIFRIFFIYFGITIAYGITVAWNDEGLSAENKVMRSPMTIALINAGWANAGYFVTTIILVTCISSINSAVYFCGRCVLRLAVDGYAPKIFAKVNKAGVPYVATNTVHLFGFLSLLSMQSSSAVAYSYIVGLAGVSAFIVWTGIIFAHYRFRKGWVRAGNSVSDLPFQAPLFPYFNYFGMLLGIVLCLVQGWTVFVPFQAGQFVDLYIMLPLFFVIWGVYKFYLKSKWVAYEDMDFVSERVDYEEHSPSIEDENSNSDLSSEPKDKKKAVWSFLWNYV